MLVVLRFDLPGSEPIDAEEFLGRARAALEVLSARPGFVRGQLGRSVDEPGSWVLTCEWESVGAYRRALSAYEVKLHATPLLATARDEASAFEGLLTAGPDGLREIASDRAVDADTAGPGEWTSSRDFPVGEAGRAE